MTTIGEQSKQVSDTVHLTKRSGLSGAPAAQHEIKCGPAEDSEPASFCLGFVTTKKLDGLGFCGGYLILNQFGHPCEFHCSLPIQPTRTHEILYGAQLTQFLIGHQIVPALLSKAKIQPAVVLSNQVQTLSANTGTSLTRPTSRGVNQPMALVLPTQSEQATSVSDAGPTTVDRGNPLQCGSLEPWPPRLTDPELNPKENSLSHLPAGWQDVPLGGSHIAFSPTVPLHLLKQFSVQYSLAEPFQRIDEALAEAHSAAAA